MKEAALDPSLGGLFLAGLLMVALVTIAWINGVRMVRQGAVATARATVQLVAVGLVLSQIFALNHWAAVTATLVVMVLIAGWTAGRRVERALGATGPLFSIILALVTAVALLYVTRAVLSVEGWPARYVIPLGGIVLGNAMTAGTLAASRYLEQLRDQRLTIQAALSLGASPAQATQRAVHSSFFAATTPVINAMLIVGVVKLPGIMSGQMLGGSEPLMAAKYQLVVLFTLAFADGMTALATLWALRRRAFTTAWQPRL